MHNINTEYSIYILLENEKSNWIRELFKDIRGKFLFFLFWVAWRSHWPWIYNPLVSASLLLWLQASLTTAIRKSCWSNVRCGPKGRNIFCILGESTEERFFKNIYFQCMHVWSKDNLQDSVFSFQHICPWDSNSGFHIAITELSQKTFSFLKTF